MVLRIYSFLMLFLLFSCITKSQKQVKEGSVYKNSTHKITNTFDFTDADWKKMLSPEEYRVFREKGTERPFSSKEILYNTKQGVYTCKGCGTVLFSSDTKFDAGCGWPSFYSAIADSVIIETEDRSHGMIRTEITCGKCGGHLGHVFDDGPNPTGLRYCVNGVSIKFEEIKK